MIKQYIIDLKNEFQGYNMQKLSQDLLAGVTVAAVALPLALALGISSGLNAAAGLISAILAGFIMAGLSGASYQVSGPTGAMTAVLFTLVQTQGVQAVFIATFLAGIFLLLASVCRFGKLVALIPDPVITGFTSGIGVIIALGQVNQFLGIMDSGGKYIPNIYAILLGCFVIIMMNVWPKKWESKIPSCLLAIVLTVLITMILQLPVELVGDIPKTLFPENRLYIRMFSIEKLKVLTLPALSIAALTMIESLLCGASAGKMKGEKLNANRELVAQGIGNMIIPFCGGLPATAVMARTSVALKSGAQTRLTSIFHALGLLISMFLLGSMMSKIPLSALAGVLIVTAWRMNDWDNIKFIFHTRFKTSIAQFLITMIATVVLDLTFAIIIGIIFSVLLFMVRISDIEINFSDIDMHKLEERGIETKSVYKKVKVIYLTGPVCFTTTDKLRREIEHLDHMVCVIFSMRGVPLIDTTGIQALKDIYVTFNQQGTKVLFSSIQPKVKEIMEQSEFLEEVGRDHFYWSVEEAITHIFS